MWIEFTYPFPNVDGATVEVWERVSTLSHALAGIKVRSC